MAGINRVQSNNRILHTCDFIIFLHFATGVDADWTAGVTTVESKFLTSKDIVILQRTIFWKNCGNMEKLLNLHIIARTLTGILAGGENYLNQANLIS